MIVLVDGKPIDYTPLPDHLGPGVERYIEDGILPGDFLRAVIRNDLKEAVLRADPESLEALTDIVRWFHNHAPPESFGGRERMNDWSRQRQAERRKP